MKHIRSVMRSVFTIAAAFVVAATAMADVKDGLVSYWPLDNNFNDAIGQNPGEFFGGGLETFGAGKFGNGIVLDGVDQYIEIQGDESEFDFVDQDFSISAWFRVDEFTKNWQALIAKGENNTWRVHRRDATPTMTWNGGNADVPVGTNPNIDDGQIHHFVGVSLAGQEVRMYMDGQLVSVGPAPIGTNNDQPVMIGENPDALGRTWGGLIDDVAIWGRGLNEGEVNFLWNGGAGRRPTDAGDVPPIFIGGENTIGTRDYNGQVINPVYSDLEPPQPGLLQEWHQVGNPGNKTAIDDIFEGNEPVVPPFRAGHGTSWWTGNQAEFGDLVKYPDEVQPTFNPNDNDNYVVRLTGEINIPESGTYRFTDGVDDFTYLAIDADKSGIAGDDPSEVLINDNAWTSVFRDQNTGGGGLGEIDIDVAAGGEWLAIEFNMGEGGGSDAGVIYWDYNVDAPAGQRLNGAVGFPEFVEDFLFADEAELMYIPDSHLRSAARTLLSADRIATVSSDNPMQFDVNGDTGEADQLVLTNPDPTVYTTKMTLDNLEFQIKSTGNVSSGEAFVIVNADEITGNVTVSSVNPGQNWVWDAATGRVCLDTCPPVGGGAGDYNGDGAVDVLDINLQAQAMNSPNPDLNVFDENADGKVDEADRYIWVREHKGTWVGDADFDGEFKSTDFVTVFLAGLYETGEAAGWGEGDWDGDLKFGSSDFVAAFLDGGYEVGPLPAAAVPEPSSLVLALLSVLSLVGVARRRNG